MNNDMTEHSSKTQGSYTASATSLQTNASKQTGLLVIVKVFWKCTKKQTLRIVDTVMEDNRWKLHQANPAVSSAQNWQKKQKTVEPRYTHLLGLAESTLHERNAAVKPYLQHGNKAKWLTYARRHRNWDVKTMAAGSLDRWAKFWNIWLSIHDLFLVCSPFSTVHQVITTSGTPLDWNFWE